MSDHTSMSGEDKFWMNVWGILGSVFLLTILTISSCTQNMQEKAIAEREKLTEKGYTASSIACMQEGSNNRNNSAMKCAISLIEN